MTKDCLVFSPGQRVRLDNKLDPHCPEHLAWLYEHGFVGFETLVMDKETCHTYPVGDYGYSFSYRRRALDSWKLFCLKRFDALLILPCHEKHLDLQMLADIELFMGTGIPTFFLLQDPRPEYWLWLKRLNKMPIVQVPSTARLAICSKIFPTCRASEFDILSHKFVLTHRAEQLVYQHLYAGFQCYNDVLRAKLLDKYAKHALGIGPTEPWLPSITNNNKVYDAAELVKLKALSKYQLFVYGDAHARFGGWLTLRGWDAYATNTTLLWPTELDGLLKRIPRETQRLLLPELIS